VELACDYHHANPHMENELKKRTMPYEKRKNQRKQTGDISDEMKGKKNH